MKHIAPVLAGLGLLGVGLWLLQNGREPDGQAFLTMGVMGLFFWAYNRV